MCTAESRLRVIKYRHRARGVAIYVTSSNILSYAFTDSGIIPKLPNKVTLDVDSSISSVKVA